MVLTLSALPGVIYLLAGLNETRGALGAEAVLGARNVTRLINTNPDYWQYEISRIGELLSGDTVSLYGGKGWRIIDNRGAVVVQSSFQPPEPVIRATETLHDFGKPVARIEISSSFRHALWRGTLILLLGSAAGVSAVVALHKTVNRRLLSADQRRRESEAKYRQLFRTEVDAIVIFDAESGRFIDVNPAAVDLYGYGREEFLSLSIRDITAEAGRTAESVRRTLENGSFQIPFRRHRRKDGTVFPVEISASTFTLGERRVLCGIIRDITTRIRREDELLRSQRQLRALSSELASAEERERREVAAVLHDEIGQLLALCKLHLEEAPGAAPGGSVRDASSARSILDQAISRVRDLTYELSSQTLYDIGLSEALEELCATIQERYGLRCSLVWEGRRLGVPPEIRGTIYRAVRELLFNTVRHAGAGSATVTASSEGGWLRIDVKDDGRGFSPYPPELHPTKGGRFGLFNVRERLNYLGGAFAIESSPQEGSRVSLSIPLETELPAPGP